MAFPHRNDEERSTHNKTSPVGEVLLYNTQVFNKIPAANSREGIVHLRTIIPSPSRVGKNGD